MQTVAAGVLSAHWGERRSQIITWQKLLKKTALCLEGNQPPLATMSHQLAQRNFLKHCTYKASMSILLQSCVGRGQRTTPTTLQDRKKVQCSSFLLLHRTLKCLFPQDGLKDSTSLTNVMTLFLHPYIFIGVCICWSRRPLTSSRFFSLQKRNSCANTQVRNVHHSIALTLSDYSQNCCVKLRQMLLVPPMALNAITAFMLEYVHTHDANRHTIPQLIWECLDKINIYPVDYQLSLQQNKVFQSKDRNSAK